MSRIDHPRHYAGYDGVPEAITICQTLPFCAGNVCKYLLRAEFKGSAEDDVLKAWWYIDHLCNSRHEKRIQAIPDAEWQTVERFVQSLCNAFIRMNKSAEGVPVDLVAFRRDVLWAVNRLVSVRQGATFDEAFGPEDERTQRRERMAATACLIDEGLGRE